MRPVHFGADPRQDPTEPRVHEITLYYLSNSDFLVYKHERNLIGDFAYKIIASVALRSILVRFTVI